MIVFIHLLNDWSGSPKVLTSTISALGKTIKNSRLFVGCDGNGWLAYCGVPTTCYWYKRTRHRAFTLFTYLFSQTTLFFKLLADRSIKRDAIIYINTLLPFGAALYGYLTGRKVIYHVHEMSIAPGLLKLLLTSIARWTSSLNIYVSDAHLHALPIKGVPARRVYNALDRGFTEKAEASTYAHCRDGVFVVLMVTSLRDYKGVPELLAVADTLRPYTNIRFELLVNDSPTAIASYFSKAPLPTNVTMYSNTPDPTLFYSRASLVMNLSRVDQCIETFGMTILEALAFGIPVIAPPAGGPTELVTDGVHGYLIDSRMHSDLCARILCLANDDLLCMEISEACRTQSKKFSLSCFEVAINDVVCNVLEIGEQ